MNTTKQTIGGLNNIIIIISGNLVLNSDDEYLVPTGYNLGVDKRHLSS
jgi:hypothetical protein